MPGTDPKSKLAELVRPAKSSLDDLLQLKELKNDQWYMRLSVGGQAGSWEFLTSDSATNDRLIKEKIVHSESRSPNSCWRSWEWSTGEGANGLGLICNTSFGLRAGCVVPSSFEGRATAGEARRIRRVYGHQRLQEYLDLTGASHPRRPAASI